MLTQMVLALLAFDLFLLGVIGSVWLFMQVNGLIQPGDEEPEEQELIGFHSPGAEQAAEDEENGDVPLEVQPVEPAKYE